MKKPSSKSPKKTTSKKKNKKDFLVVSLGASAGGIKALQEFFATMPPNSGMAFVVILHLAPHHESNLAQILQTQTEMKVTQVTETIKVEPNNVYVIPPNLQLEMFDGLIRCAEAKRPHGQCVAIDIFFRTLAEAYERNAVGIILSGTGSDGTLGLKRIKESNGFAIAQDPEDAEYDSMPRSAINTQLVDWILPVHKMPEKLINFQQSSKRLHLTEPEPNSRKIAEEIQADESLREILTLLRVRTGHDFSNYKMPTLVRRVARHLQIHELEDIPSYLEILRQKPNEVQSLLKNLLINVTNFLRDKEAFAALETEIIPKLFEGKSGKDTVRVWSCGCASGEEAYSLAMLLQEHADTLSDPPKFQVFASDVDDEAIAEAREHRYPESIETDVTPDRLKRFFIKEGSFYRVRKELRESVLFAPHYVLRDPPFSRLDLISCRNLLIYLNRETQERVLQIFHFALQPHGFLFLGSSETAESATPFFAPVDKKQRIYSRRTATGATQTTLPMMPVVGRWEVRLPERKTETDRERATTLSEIHYKLLENYAPSSVLVNQDFDIAYLSGTAGRFLRFAGGEPSRNVLKAVHPDLLPDLRAALFTAQREHRSSEFPNIRVRIDGEETTVNLIVRAVDVENEASDFLLIIFEERGTPLSDKDAEKQTQITADKDEAMETVVRRLEEDLQRTKEQLRLTIEQHETTVEELKASNEELQAINEELRSASEELETSKEELQSVNEELTTVNHELKDKIDETSRVNFDLQNLMAATDIATIFLDKNLRIKRYTPPVEQLFNITPNDVGRPLKHFTHKLKYENLAEDAEKALRSLITVEREITDGKNRSYLSRFLPYRTIDDRIDGVVLNFIDITDRKTMEEILRESEEKYRTLFDSIDEGFCIIEVLFDKKGKPFDYRFLEANPAFERQTGLANAMGKTILELVPEQEKLWFEIYGKIAKTGKPKRFEQEAAALGKFYDVYAFRIGEPRDHKVAVLFNDVAERKIAEEILRETEERTRIAIEAAELATWEWDLTTDKIIWNERHFKLFGMKPRKTPMTLEVFFRHVHPQDRERISEKLQKSITNKVPFDAQFCAIIEGGEEVRWMSGYGRITETDGNGKPTQMSGVMFDITDRKQAEEALRKSEEQLRLIMESTKEYAIITFDLNGRITRWNDGAQKIFGYGEKEVLGKDGEFLFTPEDRADEVPKLEMQIALRKGRAEDERWHIRKDGSRFFASGVMEPLRDGTTEGFVKIARDQTDRMQAENALREKEKLQQFVRTQEDERRRIARDIHDHLGQQLTALRLKIDGLRSFCDLSDFSNKAKAVGYINELFDTSKQLDRDVDFIAWELRPASLEDLGLRVTLANFVREWSHYTETKAEFHTSGIGKKRLSDEIEINLYRIGQEALNNIHKHAKATNVDVLLENRKNNLVLIIEDNGIGFNPKSKSIQKKGIGLSGMRERAGIIGGTVEIESKKGKGTTIFVRVPIKYED